MILFEFKVEIQKIFWINNERRFHNFEAKSRGFGVSKAYPDTFFSFWKELTPEQIF